MLSILRACFARESSCITGVLYRDAAKARNSIVEQEIAAVVLQ